MKNDPIVAEVRAIRKTIERSCGKDPKRYAERLRRVEGEYQSRLTTGAPHRAANSAALRVAESKSRYGKT